MKNFNKVVTRFQAFFSAKRQESISHYFPTLDLSDANSQYIISKYEGIAALRKGNHNFETVLTKMNELCELINEEINNPL